MPHRYDSCLRCHGEGTLKYPLATGDFNQTCAHCKGLGTEPRRRGRVISDRPVTEFPRIIHLRLSDAQHDHIALCSRSKGIPMTQWVINVVETAILQESQT